MIACHSLQGTQAEMINQPWTMSSSKSLWPTLAIQTKAKLAFKQHKHYIRIKVECFRKQYTCTRFSNLYIWKNQLSEIKGSSTTGYTRSRESVAKNNSNLTEKWKKSYKLFYPLHQMSIFKLPKSPWQELIRQRQKVIKMADILEFVGLIK